MKITPIEYKNLIENATNEELVKAGEGFLSDYFGEGAFSNVRIAQEMRYGILDFFLSYDYNGRTREVNISKWLLPSLASRL